MEKVPIKLECALWGNPCTGSHEAAIPRAELVEAAISFYMVCMGMKALLKDGIARNHIRAQMYITSDFVALGGIAVFIDHGKMVGATKNPDRGKDGKGE